VKDGVLKIAPNIILTLLVISVYIGSDRAVKEVPESTIALNSALIDLLPTIAPVMLML
jgi:hypothetical protein